MRRLITLALLLAGVHLILPLGTERYGSESLLWFGFLILAAYTVGELGSSLGIPKIVGYLAAGMLFGPSGLGTINAAGVARLEPISDLAIALIAFLAGAELRWSEVRLRGVLLLKITFAELAVTFAALFGAIYALSAFVPLLRALTEAQLGAFALLFASIAIIHSPAVTMALLTETRSQGPVGRTTLGIVLISDIVVVLFFTLAFAAARAILPPEGAAAPPAVLVVWEIAGAILIGSLLGVGIALYLRQVGRELLFFAILVAFFGLAIAELFHVEVLLTLLVAGFVMENVSPPEPGRALLHAMERSAAPVFVVFFALAGAKIAVQQVFMLLPLVLPLALIRAGAIRFGVALGARWAAAPPEVGRYAWMGLVSQAGVAIGLTTIVTRAYPEQGVALGTLLLALIAVNETLGPFLFRHALVASGEAQEGAPPDPEPQRGARTRQRKGAVNR